MVHATEEGVPQGGCLSPILSNIYLDKLDKELESRGLRFVRYAQTFDISSCLLRLLNVKYFESS